MTSQGDLSTLLSVFSVLFLNTVERPDANLIVRTTGDEDVVSCQGMVLSKGDSFHLSSMSVNLI